jgi:hypothetical protein
MLLSKINNSVFMRAKTEECAKKKASRDIVGLGSPYILLLHFWYVPNGSVGSRRKL